MPRPPATARAPFTPPSATMAVGKNKQLSKKGKGGKKKAYVGARRGAARRCARAGRRRRGVGFARAPYVSPRGVGV